MLDAVSDLDLRNWQEADMAAVSDMSARIVEVIEIQRSNAGRISVRHEARGIGNERGVFEGRGAERYRTANLNAEEALRHEPIIHRERFVWEFVHPSHVLALHE